VSSHTSQYKRVEPPNDIVTITISREIVEFWGQFSESNRDPRIDEIIDACRAALKETE
jgi:hypothetical protein